MDDVEFEQGLAVLEHALDDIAALLGGVGERHWSAWATRCGIRLRHGLYSAFPDILGGFGGMGSVNDLVLCDPNGHKVAPEDERAVNDRLRKLLTTVYREAKALKATLDQPRR
ncbi:DUF6966 domain-containing protein [Lapillicoccus jejuensis]|uniref:DUF6966 domain-containing protein n=1 Tax=Lapillicoccus jejuensis TaxID=402171 RepID=A0A542DZZ6_9MICO|nr:hypothetical protein [Lapillicoccus jejuensis]TQJ08662.1 hypothetical protein FB458_1753 [Lapillicoccus jejuensis]